jgi:hypothetical protein
MRQTQTKTTLKKAKKVLSLKTTPQPKNNDEVQQYMLKLKHPLKREIDAVRKIIKASGSSIKERIKWNAPSYYTSADMVTFNCRQTKFVQLVFHHPYIVRIKSPLLMGEYKDRRLVHLANMKAVEENKKELMSIIMNLVKMIK